ncbi:ATP-dependent DNA helicase RecG [Rheinheimera nanhaiensis]|uniref:ATP-dependent DNA helicase RecG n=1 Tax=Rheinheimera nanhaiensis E407-8 TaxID=562729 RepID=I1DY01_9GAMM|nr:ATP-dependent DNA helicase RecG [Rheinheimera nanhaiensis]GAB58929.1 ATP-dependent DNA helicase RecG [Rheinheimera nanhaiensis E407-8]
MSTSLAKLPVSAIKGVGAKVAEKLDKLGIYSLQDILFHLPLRYEDRTRIYAIADLMPLMHGTVLGEVVSSEIQLGKRRSWLVKIKDGSGYLTLRFFHFSAAQKNAVTPGVLLRCFGEAKRGPRGLEMLHPEYRVHNDELLTEVSETLTPIYPTTEGLRQATWRNLTDAALLQLRSSAPDEYLADYLAQNWSLADALQYIHRPPPDASLQLLELGKHPAQQRLIMEELVAQQLSMYKLRSQSQQQQAIALQMDNDLQQRFLAALPFAPTQAQQRVTSEIRHDLAKTLPMLRLVQGDVGSGKTLVAALAALTAIGNGYQVALMAPTELLAEQHAANFARWFMPLGINVAWLGGKTKGKARQSTLDAIAAGSAQMIVGTHALFQQQVAFKQLALIIIDEQHRFGVHQRLALREKGGIAGCYPHQLVMTATPIPRTLAMTAYADLDTSVIDELPPGRTPVTTVAIPDTRRDDIIQRVRSAVQTEQRQAYWVCTLIEESETLQNQAAEDTLVLLQQALPDLRIGLVHGRLKAADKQAVMQQFSSGELDLLVATTVIEVGVDVPNASLMIIENPERLGLAQLHQLRGRVGRGSTASHCVLLYHAPLSKTAQARLGVLRDSNDGFVIAQRDLEIRGPGELLGTRQTGVLQFKIADLSRDAELLPQAQQLATTLWQRNPAACEQLIKRWLANKEIYGNA